MILESKNMIPQVYSKERDMQVFNKLIDIIATTCKYSIDNMGDLYDAYKCPKDLLPLLAYNLNYNYDFADTVTSNRRIIKAFTELEKNRGSKIGLAMATALSLTSLSVSTDNGEMEEDLNYVYIDALPDIEVHYDYINAKITIDYPDIYMLVRDIMDYVRPVGMTLKLRSVNKKNINTDVMLLYADVEAESRRYIPEIDSYVSRSFVNLSGIADNKWMDNVDTMFTQVSENSSVLNLNGGD